MCAKNIADIELDRSLEGVSLACSVYLASVERTQEESAFVETGTLTVLTIENSRSCAGKCLCNNRL